MRDATFLTYIPDPFGLGRAVFVVRDAAGSTKPIDSKSVEAIAGPVVTIGASRLIAELRQAECCPPHGLIDLVEALRLWKGKAKNDGGLHVADPWRFLRSSVASPEEARAIAAFHEMFEAQGDWPDDPADLIGLLEFVSGALQVAWALVCQGMEESDELARFEHVECPVAHIFYGRQASGICIDVDKVNDLIAKADREKYTAYNEIASALEVSPSGLNFRNVGPLLGKTDAAHLLPYAETPNFEEYVRLASAHSVFARQLVTLVRSSRDLRALARLRGETARRAFPEFQIVGTVTARILVSNPPLQQLRRRYRDVISADQDLKLVYLDFAQFEPGILASLSSDDDFISRYNSGDIYSELAIALFGDAAQRDTAKRMFLSFSYGMSLERIVEVLGGEGGELRLKAFQRFVSAFPGVLAYRASLEDRLGQQGFVATRMGNRRYRLRTGDLRHDERRWAVSQAVQGTASLIFKEACLGVAKKFGPQSILLPMHDALLMQLPIDSYVEDVEAAKVIMLSALNARCPEIVGKVVAAERF